MLFARKELLRFKLEVLFQVLFLLAGDENFYVNNLYLLLFFQLR